MQPPFPPDLTHQANNEQVSHFFALHIFFIIFFFIVTFTPRTATRLFSLNLRRYKCPRQPWRTGVCHTLGRPLLIHDNRSFYCTTTHLYSLTLIYPPGSWVHLCYEQIRTFRRAIWLVFGQKRSAKTCNFPHFPLFRNACCWRTEMQKHSQLTGGVHTDVYPHPNALM